MYELLYFKKTMPRDKFLKMLEECMHYYEHTNPKKHLVYKKMYMESMIAPTSLNDGSIFSEKEREYNEKKYRKERMEGIF